MRRRDALTLVITLLVGVGLGWVLAGLGAVPGGGLEGASAPGPHVAPRVQPPREAELRGRAEVAAPGEGTAPPTGPAPGGPEDRAVVESLVRHVGEDGFEFIEEWWGDPPASLGERAWLALLTLYAAAGRTDEFLRAAPLALGLPDVDEAEVLSCVDDAPEDLRASLLDALLAALPDASFAPGAVADIYLGVGAGERAVAVLLPALRENAEVGLATRLIQAAPDLAAQELGRLLGDEALDASGLTSLGQAFAGAERGDLAVPYLLASLEREPHGGDALMALAGVDPALAVAHAQALTRTSPSDTQAWNWLGQIHADAGNPEAAFEAYRRSAEGSLTTEALYGMLAVDAARALAVARELPADTGNDEVHGAVAKIAMQVESLGEAVEAVVRAHRQDPTDHEWLRAMVAIDPTRALAALDETLRGYGGDERDELIGARANALGDLGRQAEAFDAYLEAHRLDGGDWEWQRGLARADPARALDVLEAYRREHGDEADLLGAIGDAYAGVGRTDEAMRLYERAIEMDGGSEWLSHMAYADPEEATRRLDSAIREKPGDAELWFRLGEAHAIAGRREASHEAYARARELDPRNLTYGAAWVRSR